jgi:anti-sigma factor RsiW
MRCEEVHRIFVEDWSEEISAPVREHLAGCPACGTLAREYGLLRAGLRALAAQPAPEPSWGFATRVLRRLEETRDEASGEFLERAGRRVVYATCILALTLLLALVLPSSGPVRGPTTTDLYLAQSEELTAMSSPIFLGELPNGNGGTPVAPENSRTGKKP